MPTRSRSGTSRCPRETAVGGSAGLRSTPSRTGAGADPCRRDGASRLTVGTSDCSLGTIAFYRKVGFRFAGVREGYFDSYPVAVVENGIRARDMVMFQMPLAPSSAPNRDVIH